MKAYNEVFKMPSLPIRHFISHSDHTDSNAFVHPHWHDAVEILYFEEGRAKQQIGDRIFITNPQDIVVIWSNQIHSTYKLNNENCKIVVFQFTRNEIWENEIIRCIEFYQAIDTQSALWNQLHTLLHGMSSALENKEDGYEYQIKSDIYRFFATIIRNRKQLPIALKNTKSHKETIQKIFEYIDNHYTDHITLETISSAVYLSIPHFMRIFKNATGMTFKTYLNLYRINMSTALLKQGCTTSQTAEKCGFENTNTFIRVFKQYKKCTPSFYK